MREDTIIWARPIDLSILERLVALVLPAVDVLEFVLAFGH